MESTRSVLNETRPTEQAESGATLARFRQGAQRRRIPISVSTGEWAAPPFTPASPNRSLFHLTLTDQLHIPSLADQWFSVSLVRPPERSAAL